MSKARISREAKTTLARWRWCLRSQSMLFNSLSTLYFNYLIYILWLGEPWVVSSKCFQKLSWRRHELPVLILNCWPKRMATKNMKAPCRPGPWLWRPWRRWPALLGSTRPNHFSLALSKWVVVGQCKFILELESKIHIFWLWFNWNSKHTFFCFTILIPFDILILKYWTNCYTFLKLS